MGFKFMLVNHKYCERFCGRGKRAMEKSLPSFYLNFLILKTGNPGISPLGHTRCVCVSHECGLQSVKQYICVTSLCYKDDLYRNPYRIHTPRPQKHTQYPCHLVSPVINTLSTKNLTKSKQTSGGTGSLGPPGAFPIPASLDY